MEIKKIHIIGIKGWGTSGLAQLLKVRGFDVCGSDMLDAMPSDLVLQKSDIAVEPFNAENISDHLDEVIYSTGYPEDHPERERSRELRIHQVSYPQAVGELFNPMFGISVCGTHGKTTSSAMMAYVLQFCGADPVALIGSLVPQFDTNVLTGSSQYFVLETDEYQNKLRYYDPKAVLLTSVEWDHPDFFHSEHEYADAFRAFLAHKSIQHIVACTDDNGVRDVVLSAHVPPTTYGENVEADYRLGNYRNEGEKSVFSIFRHSEYIGDCTLSLIGRHNALNALGVFALCDVLGVGSTEKIIQALGMFRGTARRLEYSGTKGITKVYVDYGHHPTEVRVTLSALREQFPNQKLWCVFGSHTFSRTETFFDSFAKSFESVDRVLVLDIYGAREKEGAVHARDLAEAINTHSHNAEYTGSIDHTLEILDLRAHASDVLVCMGASEDVWKVAERFLKN